MKSFSGRNELVRCRRGGNGLCYMVCENVFCFLKEKNEQCNEHGLKHGM